MSDRCHICYSPIDGASKGVSKKFAAATRAVDLAARRGAILPPGVRSLLYVRGHGGPGSGGVRTLPSRAGSRLSPALLEYSTLRLTRLSGRWPFLEGSEDFAIGASESKKCVSTEEESQPALDVPVSIFPAPIVVLHNTHRSASFLRECPSWMGGGMGLIHELLSEVQ